MTVVVAPEPKTEPETEPHTEPAVAMEIGEIAGKLDSMSDQLAEVGQCDHAEVLARISAVEGKLDAFIAGQAAPEPIIEPEPEPVEDLTIVAPEPEPEPPEHPFFKPVFGEP